MSTHFQPIPLRPHHGMCMAYYQGKGYSEDFTENMTRTLELFAREDPLILLVHCTDILCGHCPFHHEDQCETRIKVDRYDREVLERTGLSAGSVLRVSEFRRLVKERILDQGQRPEICGDCSWNELCK